MAQFLNGIFIRRPILMSFHIKQIQSEMCSTVMSIYTASRLHSSDEGNSIKPIDVIQQFKSDGPGTSTAQQSTSDGVTREPPPLPHIRPLDKSLTGNGIEENKAKQARRNLFPEKKPHEIKDLNPYLNKYTIKARVVKKSQKETWSNSR